MFPVGCGHRFATRSIVFSIGATIDVDGIVGVRAFRGCVRVDRDKHIHVVGIHLLADLRQTAVIFFFVGCSLDIGVRAVQRAREDDVLMLHAHAFERAPQLETLPQVRVRLVEAAGVGTSRFESRVWYGCHGSVVGTP